MTDPSDEEWFAGLDRIAPSTVEGATFLLDAPPRPPEYGATATAASPGPPTKHS